MVLHHALACVQADVIVAVVWMWPSLFCFPKQPAGHQQGGVRQRPHLRTHCSYCHMHVLQAPDVCCFPVAAPCRAPLARSSALDWCHSFVCNLASVLCCSLQGISKEEFGKIFGPATMHAIGHIAANISFAAVAISLTHTVKTLEPAFNVILSRCGAYMSVTSSSRRASGMLCCFFLW